MAIASSPRANCKGSASAAPGDTMAPARGYAEYVEQHRMIEEVAGQPGAPAQVMLFA